MSESEIYHTSINIKGKTYRIDVNKNIKIKNLNVIIINAANLINSEFKLFSGDKDYTNFDENLLYELFPTKEDLINFNIQFLDEDTIKEDLNNKKLNNPIFIE